MQRRLNPQLFDENADSGVEESSHFSVIANKKMEEEILGANKSISRLESQVEVLRSQLSQTLTRYDKKLDSQSKALVQLENRHRETNLQLTQKTRMLEEQMRERKLIDNKIEVMVDRYNTSLQQFENRLAALQKVISEKEMTLLKYNSALELIFAEIEKMKANRQN